MQKENEKDIALVGDNSRIITDVHHKSMQATGHRRRK